MLVYGSPGVGKTTLAATAVNVESMRDVLVVNVEGGIMSIVEAASVGLQTTPSVFDLQEWKQLEEVFWYLRKEEHPYKTLVIDSLSELAVRNLDFVVASNNGGGRRKSPDDVWLEDYGRNTSQMRRVMRAFRDLPMHVIFTCHSADKQDEEHREQVFPSLTPKLRESVVGYMDVVAYMFTQMMKQGEGPEVLVRRLLCQPHGKWMAKDRSPGGKLGITIDNPTMPEIMARIGGQPTTTEKRK